MKTILIIDFIFIACRLSGQVPVTIKLQDYCTDSIGYSLCEVFDKRGFEVEKNKDGSFMLQEWEPYFIFYTYLRNEKLLKFIQFHYKFKAKETETFVVKRIEQPFIGDSVFHKAISVNHKELPDGYYLDCYKNGQKELLIIINRIEKFHMGDSAIDEIRYFDCDKLCEGYCIDYYKNGRKRLEGNFKQGKPKGKLSFYNEDGTIYKVERYDRKGNLKNVTPINVNSLPNVYVRQPAF